MLTKSYIKNIKYNSNGELKRLIESQTENQNILFILKNLGQLPKNFDDSWVPQLLKNKNKNIRFWTVKTLGKTKKDTNIRILRDIALNDESTDVRREAVSSIGRMRTRESKKALFEILRDNDPKVVSQAIRGLLVFKHDEDVKEKLKSFINHDNEMINNVIRSFDRTLSTSP